MQTSISTTTIEDHLHHYSPEESQKLLSRESSINTDLFKHENGMYIFGMFVNLLDFYIVIPFHFLELLEHIVEDFLICFEEDFLFSSTGKVIDYQQRQHHQ